MSEPGTDDAEKSRIGPPDRESPDSVVVNLDDIDPGLVKPQDLGSASRSCLAIIIVMIVILLLLCVFFIGQQVT